MCFINLSEEEIFGLNSIEAMASGIPAVLYDVSASTEMQSEFVRCGIAERYRKTRNSEKWKLPASLLRCIRIKRYFSVMSN